MAQTTLSTDYLATLDQLAARLPALTELRTAARAAFHDAGLPTVELEDWRFTNIAARLLRLEFVAPTADAAAQSDAVETFSLGGLASSRQLVFIDGAYRSDLSAAENLPAGVTLTGLADALGSQPELVTSLLGKYAPFENAPEAAFVALNTAGFTDGAFLHVPNGVVVEGPIHLLYLTTGAATTAVHPRTLIALGEHAQASVIESYAGPDGAAYLTNAVSEIVLGPAAVLDHYRLQREGNQALFVHTQHIHQDRASAFSTHTLSIGSAMTRNDVYATLAGEGIDCVLDGLYMPTGKQHVDNHTTINHAAPHCRSFEIYKGILDDQSRGGFNGKIFVQPDAQKTDAKQTNQTLLLSDDAQLDTKPQLEIFADDVRCTHGATIGQLDQNHLFYLRARGIGPTLARQMLIHAFAAEALERMKLEPLRTYLDDILFAHRPKELFVELSEPVSLDLATP